MGKKQNMLVVKLGSIMPKELDALKLFELILSGSYTAYEVPSKEENPVKEEHIVVATNNRYSREHDIMSTLSAMRKEAGECPR